MGGFRQVGRVKLLSAESVSSLLILWNPYWREVWPSPSPPPFLRLTAQKVSWPVTILLGGHITSGQVKRAPYCSSPHLNPPIILGCQIFIAIQGGHLSVAVFRLYCISVLKPVIHITVYCKCKDSGRNILFLSWMGIYIHYWKIESKKISCG